MRSRYAAWASLVIVIGAVLAACSTATPETSSTTGTPLADLVVSMNEWRFAPANVQLPANRATTVELRNDGGVVHEWAVLSIPIASESEFRPELVITTLRLEPSQVDRLVLDALAPGTYQIVCPIAGHMARGMVGTLEISGD